MRPTRRGDIDAPAAQTRRALRSGELVVVRRGVLVGRDVLEASQDDARARHALIAKGAILVTEGAPAYACLGSAALLHGMDRLGRPPERVRLYRAKGRPWRDDEIAVLTCGLPTSHLTVVDEVPCTTAARTVVDLARWVSYRSGVVVADSALRRGTTRQDLEKVARDCTRWPGIRKAREVIAFADGSAATPLESISRLSFHRMGLPAPETQVVLARDDWRNPRIIVDFYWPEFRVVGEADGLLKYDAENQSLRKEKLRQEEIESMGYVVVRWTWDDIWRRPEWVAKRLRNAMTRQANHRAQPTSDGW